MGKKADGIYQLLLERFSGLPMGKDTGQVVDLVSPMLLIAKDLFILRTVSFLTKCKFTPYLIVFHHHGIQLLLP